MSDIDQAISLVRSGTLSVDQMMLYHLNGLLRPLPGQGVRVQCVGDVAPYVGDEVVAFHPELAAALVQRGVASYVV